MCGTTVPQLLRPNGIACAEPLVLLAFVGKSFYARRVGRRWVQDTPGPSTGAPPDSDSRALSNPIQEQIEPELELGRVTVPGPHDVLGRDLSKVGARAGSRRPPPSSCERPVRSTARGQPACPTYLPGNW